MKTANATAQQRAIARTEYAEIKHESNENFLNLFQELSHFQYEDMSAALMLELMRPEMLRRMTH